MKSQYALDVIYHLRADDGCFRLFFHPQQRTLLGSLLYTVAAPVRISGNLLASSGTGD